MSGEQRVTSEEGKDGLPESVQNHFKGTFFRTPFRSQKGDRMTFRRGQKVEIYRKSDDESWQEYMNKYIGVHGRVTDPDASKNDPDALIEVSLDEKGTHRFPQDCLRPLDD